MYGWTVSSFQRKVTLRGLSRTTDSPVRTESCTGQLQPSFAAIQLDQLLNPVLFGTQVALLQVALSIFALNSSVFCGEVGMLIQAYPEAALAYSGQLLLQKWPTSASNCEKHISPQATG